MILLSGELLAGAAAAARGEYLADLVEFAFGLGQGLVQAARLTGVQFRGVGQHSAVTASQRIEAADLDRGQPVEVGDPLVVAGRDGQQVRMLGRGP